LLVAECLDGPSFAPARAAQALADRAVCASDLAERLTAETGIDYRRAHGVVGRLVTQLEARGRSLADAVAEDLVAALRDASVELEDAQSAAILISALDPASCVAARTGFGCAAPEEVAAMADELGAAARKRRDEIAKMRARRTAAIDALFDEARVFMEGPA
jgi:argininosuccinate lyase